MAYGTRGFGGFGFSFRLTPVVKRLLIANTVVFVATLALGASLVFDWFAFQPSRILTRPWGVATYMFLHAGFGHLFFNMLVLFFFGPPLEARWGGREFLRFYLVCGLGGAALGFLFMPSLVVGASGAVFGLMLAFAMNWPEAPIYVWGIFPVKAKWLVGFMALVTLFNTFAAPGGPTAHFAHLGGLLAGLIYLKADWRTGEKVEKLKRRATRVRRLAIVPRDEDEEEPHRRASGARGYEAADERRLLDAVDRVLDKISAEGMASLTPEERSLLDEVSRRHKLN